MKSLRLLHISDLHRLNKNTIGETKQKDIQHLNPIITDQWEDDFIKTISRWESNNTKIDILAFTGDLGEKGEHTSIEEGASFLGMLLEKLNLKKEKLIICPGNHDLEREKGDAAFDTFIKCMDSVGITNFCKKDEVCQLKVDDISIFAVNSCLATQKSVFVEKYQDLLKTLTEEDKKSFKEEAQKLKQEYLEDYLDIPAITKIQRDNLESLIKKDDGDCAIILVHHNLFQNKSVECRPYCNVVDGGVTLDMLNSLEKNIFLIHGHIHFNDSTLAFFPQKNENFISSLGTGCLNGNNGASANILEFFFTDENNHIITNIYQCINEGGGFNMKPKYSIYDKLTFPQQKINYEPILKENSYGIEFGKLLSKLGSMEADLLKVLLRDPNVSIRRNKSSNFQEWTFSSKK